MSENEPTCKVDMPEQCAELILSEGYFQDSERQMGEALLLCRYFLKRGVGGPTSVNALSFFGKIKKPYFVVRGRGEGL